MRRRLVQDDGIEQEPLDDLRALGPAEEEALRGVAARGLEVAELLGGLDPSAVTECPSAWRAG
jgi:hypothetical protein